MDSGISSGSQLRCSIRSYRRKEEEKEPAEQRSSAHVPRLQSCPQQTQSSTISKAQPPNLDDAREAFPTITCWNVLMDNSEDCRSYIMRAQDLSIYRKAVRTKDGKLPPEPVLGDSVMSGRHLRSVISGRPLF